MGKYIRKAKTTGEVAVMDHSLGVRTRAKTLALKRQGRLHAASSSSSSSSARRPPPPRPQPPSQDQQQQPGSGGYLQLRSRRLEKPPVVVNDSKRQKNGHNKVGQAQNPNANLNSKKASRGRVGPVDSESGPKIGTNGEEIQEDNIHHNNNNNESKDLGIEASFGENALDTEGRERSARESTPCSLIRDPETVRTPGSTTKPTYSTETNKRTQNSVHRHIPTAQEMDEFFARAEEEQRKEFIEKYNFDPVDDKPLPGRFEWEKLAP